MTKGGRWIIALEYETHVISGANLNFGEIRALNAYQTEVYTSLTATSFNIYPPLIMPSKLIT